MSASVSNKSVSVVIFDRTKQYGSDVPVFSAALKQKVNTSTVDEKSHAFSGNTQVILSAIQGQGEVQGSRSKGQEGETQISESRSQKTEEYSSSRADSFGGQTNEFAQGEEKAKVRTQDLGLSERYPLSHRGKDKQDSQPAKSFVFEDPSLIRPRFSSVALFSFLEAQIPIPISIPPLSVPLLSSTHRLGIQDFVYIPARSLSWKDSLEPYWYLSRLLGRDVAEKIHTLRQKEWSISPYIQPVVADMMLSLQQRRALLQNSYQSARSIVVEIAPKYLARGQRAIQHFRGHTFHLPRLHLHLSWDVPAIDEATLFIRKQKLQLSLVQLASRTLIAGSMVLMLLTVGPMVALEAESWRQQIAYSIHNMASQAVESSYPVPTLLPSSIPTPPPTPNPDPEKQFQIIIPKIGINSKIIANVDASNEKEYTEALKKGVAHAKGTGLPGEANTENKTIFIFGHSTNATWNIARYNALFYSLKDLSVGDDLSVWFWGREFHYVVSDRKIVEPDDVSFLLPQTIKDQLILQTCWPPGTSAKRLLVIATPKE